MILSFSEYSLMESNNFIDIRHDDSEFVAIHFKNNLILCNFKNYGGLPTDEIEKSLGISNFYAQDYVLIFIDSKKKQIRQEKMEFLAGKDRRDRLLKMTNAVMMIDPKKLKKLIDDLMNRKIIDSSYKLEIKNDDKFQKLKIFTLDFNENDFYYHGTTEDKADSILKKGLRPQDTDHAKSLFRGNSSTIIGYTDKNVYLTKSIDTAKSYAMRQAAESDYPPVVLRVKVPDESKLFIDDDILIRELKVEIAKEFNKIAKPLIKNSPEYYELEKGIDRLSKYSILRDKLGNTALTYYTDIFSITKGSKMPIYSLPSYIENLIRYNLYSMVKDSKITQFHGKFPSYSEDYSNTMNDYYLEHLDKSFYQGLINLIKKEYRNIININYKKSLYDDVQAVAYNGIIMPKFIEKIDVEYKTRLY